SVTCTDPTGAALDKPWENMVRAQVTNPESPINASFHIHIPPYAPPGTYKLNIRAQDKVRNAVADFAPVFTVEASKTYLPASKLEQRDFQYSRIKDGEAISTAEYRQGETV